MPGPVRPNGMTSAAAALQMLERRQAVLANNLANASTRGFKAERTFARMMQDAISVTDTAVDLTPGTLTETRAPLDLAVNGDGFFVVDTPAGERWTRGGSFQLDADRRIIDESGNPLLGEEGAITLPHGIPEIDATGQIKVGNKIVARLRLETSSDSSSLEHEGGTRFVPDAARTIIANDTRSIKQGSIEESNVNPMVAMTEMLEALRQYGSAQKTISTLDAARGIAVTDLAKPV